MLFEQQAAVVVVRYTQSVAIRFNTVRVFYASL